jgi:phospholipid/cholesterol/gamma-HCH transport system substrate-binding protein
LTQLEGVVAKLNQIDAGGISNQIILTGKAVENFFKGKEMQTILAKLGAASANLASLTARVDKVLAGGGVEEVLAGSRETLKVIRGLVAALQEEIKAMKLPEFAREAESTAANLRTASDTLDKFLERISDRPPDLLFGKPPRKRWNE